MKIYLSNKMTGIPFFNAPWFDKKTAELMSLDGITEVFNPAEHDRKRGLDPMLCPTGHPDEARAQSFQSLASTLMDDWSYIAYEADAVVVGGWWENSKGAISEVACAQALGKPCYEIEVFQAYYGKDHLSQLALPPIMELGGPPVGFSYKDLTGQSFGFRES